ncbi:MAG TPA: hypothetical protein VH351_16855 [Bryobacteraceae bacterium]|nr:hypothetical protein [Bryobacteraceae bacterium]
MKLFLSLGLSAYWLVVICAVSSAHEPWTITEQATVQKNVPVSAPFRRIVIDNFDGSVHVTGSDASQVVITAYKKTAAKASFDLQQANSDVKLTITTSPEIVSVYYDAPWRCHKEETGCCCKTERHFYDVTYDIDVQVPRRAETIVSTVNHGDIVVNGIAGPFSVDNVNGAIRMTDIRGSGDARTVNGPVSVRFAKNPTGPGTYKSINGRLDFYFQPGLTADLLFKTFNGQIYSDFDVASRPPPQPVVERHDGRFVYRSNGMYAARAGSGGPELSFDAFNGDIRLHKSE